MPWKRIALILLLVVAALELPTSSFALERGACTPTNVLILSDPLGDMLSPCVLERGNTLLEGLYYQNASLVGGTALAAYPMFRVRYGIMPHAELFFDTPSQIAQSGLAGAGLYPRSRPGYGLNYMPIERKKFAVAIQAEERPPESYFSPTLTQPKYSFSFTTLYRRDNHFRIAGLIAATTSQRIGFNQLFPLVIVGPTFTLNRRTEFAVDAGTRFIARHAYPQYFTDASITKLVGENVAVNLGLGTAFNACSGSKSHYLAFGASYLIKRNRSHDEKQG